MSVSYVNGATGQSRLNSTVAVSQPAGLADGDVLVATIITADGGASLPAGWVEQNSGFTSINAFSVRLATKVASGEPASWTFGVAGGFAGVAVTVDAYRGVDQATPMDAAATILGGSAVDYTFPDITPVSDHARHYASAGDSNSSTRGDLTGNGYASRSFVFTPTTLLSARSFDKDISPPAAISGLTTTLGAGSDWVSFSAALRPAGAGGGPSSVLKPTFIIPLYDELS